MNPIFRSLSIAGANSSIVLNLVLLILLNISFNVNAFAPSSEKRVILFPILPINGSILEIRFEPFLVLAKRKAAPTKEPAAATDSIRLPTGSKSDISLSFLT